MSEWFQNLPGWLHDLLPIIILLGAVGVVIARLPKVQGLDYTDKFRRRRVMNWVPLGLTYAFLYMGRYNLKVSQRAFGAIEGVDGGPMMTNAGFATIFMVGAIVYGVSFVINGPLTDRFGGKRAMLVGSAGAALLNVLMGVCTWSVLNKGPAAGFVAEHFLVVFSVLYGANMYFQSFGAVAIVKVNAPWFHVRERGVIGAVFGILISLGVYFAFDWSKIILNRLPLEWVFLMPGIVLVAFWLVDLFVVFDRPSLAGHPDIELGDATSGDTGPQKGAAEVFKMMLSNPIIMTIACIEFCSGFLRQAIMQWYPSFAVQTDATLGLMNGFVNKNWGILLCCAGILGGVVAGVISDRVFGSRRGPVAGILYGALLLGAVALTFVYVSSAVGYLVLFMSLAVIGVHGMLSGTASMDFGGSKNAGIAVGIIDGFVYLGTGVMALVYGLILPKDQIDADGRLVGPATDPANWAWWPIAMIPLALIGFVLALRVWNSRPKSNQAAAH